MRRKISRSSVLRHAEQPGFLQISDELTAQIFNEEQFGYLSVFRISNEQLSDHVASLINNKPLKHEILNVQEFDRNRQVRLEKVEKLCEETHTLFYTKYNKESLSQFLNSIENVIILEYFLALVIYSIKNQVAEISTFGETIDDIK